MQSLPNASSQRFPAYLRVSTEEQDTLEAQLAACQEYARKLGGVIVATDRDKISGLDTQRPGYQRVLKLAREHSIDGVVVYRLDRFGRDAGEGIRAAQELQRLGVDVHSVTEPLGDPFVRDLMFVLVGRESRVPAERVRMGQRAKVREGRWMSRPPVGYARGPDGQLMPDAKAPAVEQLFDLAAAGRHSIGSLRDEARRLGLTSTTGRPITRSAVSAMLRNPAYVGDTAGVGQPVSSSAGLRLKSSPSRTRIRESSSERPSRL